MASALRVAISQVHVRRPDVHAFLGVADGIMYRALEAHQSVPNVLSLGPCVSELALKLHVGTLPDAAACVLKASKRSTMSCPSSHAPSTTTRSPEYS